MLTYSLLNIIINKYITNLFVHNVNISEERKMRSSKNKKKNLLTKGLVMFMAFALLLQPLMLSGFASGDGNESYSSEILAAKGGADAIATFTFDDGFYANDSKIAEVFGEYKMPATLMVVPSRILATPPYNNGYSNVAQLNLLIQAGLDVQSHSYSHIYMAPEGHVDYTEGNNTEENREREISGSRDFLKTNFQGIDPIAFAVPGSAYDEASMLKVMETFYAARARSGVDAGTFQSLTPTDDASAGGWYGIRTEWLYNDTVDATLAYLKTCVNNGGWFLAGAHNIVDYGHYDITVDNLKTILDAAKAYSDAGKLWVASFSDAVKYLREYENTTLKQYTNDFGMYVELNMAEKTANGLDLSADIFDMPLTVKVEVENGLSRVRFSQKGVNTLVDTFTEGGKTYAYAEIVPNSGAVLVTDATKDLTLYNTAASLTLAKDGANAIATLTFDDGLSQTASKLNELCAEYGVKASLMIPSNSWRLVNSLSFWKQLVSEGNLSIEGHGKNHDYIGGNPNYSGYVPGNDSPENINDEILGSLADYRNYLPDQDALGYTVPSATYITEAYKVLYQNYYAAIGGECVLSESSNIGKVQSLDPATGDPATGAYKEGSWYQLYYARFQPLAAVANPQYYANLTMENILGYLDSCVESNGWFITSAHGMFEEGYLDYTEEDAIALLSKIGKYQDEGKVWSATFSEAIKYIRERQNSTIKVTTYGDGVYFADLTMADKTAEGLSLNVLVDMPDGTQRQIFNMPLTVKVEVPNGWTEVQYTQAGGSEQYAATFTELGKTYAYVNLLPNGGTATITSKDAGSLEGATEDKPVGSYEQPEGTYVPTNTAVTYATWATEADFLAGKAPVKEYTEESLLNANIAGVGYVHLYTDLDTSDKTFITVNTTIDLAGHTLKWPQGNKIENGLTLTVKNGRLENYGQIQIRANNSMIFDNVHFISAQASHGWVFYGNAGDLTVFKDCIIELNSQNSHFYLAGGDDISRANELKFINTDIIVGGTVSKDLGLFYIKEAGYGTTKWVITFDKNSTITGKVETWVCCEENYDSREVPAEQPFSEQQVLLFEEGFAFCNNSIPDFTYRFIQYSDATNYTVKNGVRANDSILKMGVAYPGTTYELLGEIAYDSQGAYNVIKVENATIDKPTGSYITPEGAWQPSDPGVVWAIWASENSYLQGKAPYKQFTTNVLDCAETLMGGGYVHCFGDVVTGSDASDKVFSPSGVMLKINLGGHKLVANYGFGTQERSLGLTVCNGIVENRGQTNLKDGDILFENLYIYQYNKWIGYGCIHDSWIYRDCILDIKASGTYYVFGGNPLTEDSVLKFENTDIVISSGSVDSKHGLLAIAPDYYGNYNYTVIFDGNSSLVGEVPVLVSCVGDEQKYAGVQTVIIEEGFTVSSDAIPTFKYIKAPMRDYTAGTETVRDANDSLCNIFVAAPGELTATTEEYSFLENGELYTLTLASNYPTDEPDNPDTPVNPDAWTPKADTTYAVWNSVEDYQAGKAPIAEYNGNLDVDNFNVGTRYVRLFKNNVSVVKNILLIEGQTVVIDLAGFTLTNSVGIEIYGGASLTIENGKYLHTSGQLYYRPVSTMIYRNLVMTVDYAGPLTYGYGCSNLVYENCTVTLNNSKNNFLLGSASGAPACSIKILDTQFIVNAALDEPFIKICQSVNTYDPNYTIEFGAGSSITGSGSIPGFIRLEEYYNPTSKYHGKFTNTCQTVKFDKDFYVAKNLIVDPTVYTLSELDYDASVAAGRAVYKSPVTFKANDNYCKIYLGDTLVGDSKVYLNPNPSAANNYSFSYDMDKVNVLWYRVFNDEMLIGVLATKDGNGMALFTSAELNALAKGETVWFAQSAVTGDDVTGNSAERTDLTFDLCGNTIYFRSADNRFNLSLYVGGEYRRLAYTFKNGTLESSIKQPFYGFGRYDSVITLDGITFNYTYSESTGKLLDMYSGTFVIKNSTVNAAGHFVTFFQKGNNYHAVVIENSTVTAAYAIGMYQNAQMQLDYNDFYIKDSVLNCSSAVICVENDSSVASSYTNLDIIGSKINAPTVLYVDYNRPLGKVNVRLSDTYLAISNMLKISTEMSENTELYKVIFAGREKLMAIEGYEGYGYYVGTAPVKEGDVSANLTLFTNFNLNFFVDPASIVGVYYNGVQLESVDFEGLKKYTVANITPNTAADDITVEIAVIKDGVTYRVPLTYSVLTYAKQVNAGNYSTLAKQLVKSAVEYIQAAYVYCGKAAPEFVSDVTVTRPDMTGEQVEALTAAIQSVQLNLKESPYVRFNLKSGYTGKLKINGYSYEVADGKVGELTYVELDLRAYTITDTITITADTTVEYTLKDYRNSDAVQADGLLSNLIDALYTYGAYAKQYRAQNPNLD